MTAGTLKERTMVTFAINTRFIRKRPAQAVLTVAGFSGVVLVFLPFIYSYVPVEVLLDMSSELLFRLALVGPFVVLPFFISVGQLRWLLSGTFSHWESRLGYALALIVVVLFSLLIVETWYESGFDDYEMWLIFLCPGLGLSAGGWFVFQNLRHRAVPDVMGLVALHLTYLPVALFWLVFPVSVLIESKSMLDMPIGSFLTLFTVFIYTAQAALALRSQPRLMLGLLPFGVVWVSGVAWWAVGLLGGL